MAASRSDQSIIPLLPKVARKVALDTMDYYLSNKDKIDNFFQCKDVINGKLMFLEDEYKKLESKIDKLNKTKSALEREIKSFSVADTTSQQNELKNTTSKISLAEAEYGKLYEKYDQIQKQHGAALSQFTAESKISVLTQENFKTKFQYLYDDLSSLLSNKTKELILDKPFCPANKTLEEYLHKRYEWEKEHKGESLPEQELQPVVLKSLEIQLTEFSKEINDLKRQETKAKNEVKLSLAALKLAEPNLLGRLTTNVQEKELHKDALNALRDRQAELEGSEAKKGAEKLKGKIKRTEKIFKEFFKKKPTKAATSSPMPPTQEMKTPPLAFKQKEVHSAQSAIPKGPIIPDFKTSSAVAAVSEVTSRSTPSVDSRSVSTSDDTIRPNSTPTEFESSYLESSSAPATPSDVRSAATSPAHSRNVSSSSDEEPSLSSPIASATLIEAKTPKEKPVSDDEEVLRFSDLQASKVVERIPEIYQSYAPLFSGSHHRQETKASTPTPYVIAGKNAAKPNLIPEEDQVLSFRSLPASKMKVEPLVVTFHRPPPKAKQANVAEPLGPELTKLISPKK